MKTLGLLSGAVLLLSLTLAAQTTPTPVPTMNTISVGAEGNYEAEPDTAVVRFGVSAQEASAKAAYDRASQATEKVRELLRRNGIEPKAAEIGYLSLQPVYDYRNPKRKLVGYQVNTSVVLKLHDFAKVAPIVQGLSDLDITDSQSISYVLENMEAAKTKAAENGLVRARNEAAAVASTAGRTLGQLAYASVDTFEVPRPVPYRAMAMSVEKGPAPEPTAEFSAQKVTVTAHVNAVFDLK